MFWSSNLLRRLRKHPARRRQRRLVVEQLEMRLTPSSGEIHGTIWNDANGNGVRDPGEAARPGVTVYLDLKQDGRLDPGDPSTLSAADGSYAFTGLDLGGTYVVAEMLPNSWQQTSPGSPPARTVTIPGVPVTINFDSLTSPSDQTIPAYHQAGFTLDTSVNLPTKFDIWGTADAGHYAGKTAASSESSPATISLTQDSGQTFNLTSMDLASWWNSVFTPTITFTGIRTDAPNVQQTVTLSNQLQFQTVTFNGFTNIRSVQWGFTGTNDYHQFTNVVVTGTEAPIVTGVDFGVNSYSQPIVSVSDGLAVESAGGSVKFTVALSSSNPYPVTVNYATADGTALAGRDYAATAGAVTIPANTFRTTITVPVIATNAGAPDRFFYLNLRNAINAQVTRGQGVGTIEDDTVVVAANDSYVLTTTSLSVPAPGVLANDRTANRAALTASLVSQPANGGLTFNADGSFTYTPGPSFSGQDTFTYRALGGTLPSNIATVTITTNPANQSPVASNDSYSVNENQTLIVGAPSATSLYMNSQTGDFIGQGHTYFFTPATGTFLVQRNSDNSVSFNYQGVNSEFWSVDFAAPQKATLTPGFYGNAAEYPFQPSNQPGLDISGDGRGSDTITGNFTVRQAVYDAAGKVLNFDATFEQHSEGATPALFGEIMYFYAPGPAGVLSNDADQEGQLLSAILVNGPSNGTLNLNANGSFTYIPNPNFAGTDAFTYKANDGADSNLATVTITVNPVNQAPTFTKGPDQVVTENSGAQRVAGWATNIAAGPPNESTQAVNFVVSNDHNALFSVQPAIDASGTLTYTPASNAYGVAKVTVLLHDNGGTAKGGIDTSAAQTFTITLNDPPAVSDSSYITNENTPLTVTAQGTTSLFLLSQLGDDVGTGDTRTFTSSTGSFTVSSNSDNGVSFFYSDHNPNVLSWQGDFAAAFKARLTPGYYGNVAGYPFQANNVPGLEISGNGRGPGSVAGNFTVKQAFYNAAGNPLNFDASFEQHSDGAAQALFGEFKFNALAGPAGIMSSAVDFVGNPLTALLVTAPTHGQLTLNPNGTFTYTPNANFFGTDTFQYKANDSYLDSNVATVTIIVRNLASSLAVSGFASPAVSGNAGTFTVSALDAQGNPVPGYTGTVHFTSSDAQAALPADYTFTAADAGQHKFSATLETAGTQSLTATDTVTSSVTGTQASIVVEPAGFLVNGFPGTTTAGVAQTFSVTAQNANGTTAAGYTGTVHFTSSDTQAVLPADYAFTAADAGAHTFSATLKTAGSQSLTATDTATASINGTQTGITVNPAAANNLAVSGFPSPTTAGMTGAFTVTAQDTYGNTATGYTGTVHFTSSDSQLGAGDVPADYTFAAADHGTKTFTAILRTPGTQSITATDTVTNSIAGTQAGITVNAPPAPQIVDNGTAGYSETGAWTTESVPSYGGNERYATSSGTGQNTATWQVNGLPTGFYQAQVSWHPYPNQAPDAPYAIYDGGTLLQTVTVNQRMAASGSMFGGVPFQTLGTFKITSGTLKVVLSNTGGGTYIVADAMREAFVPVSSTDLNWSATGDGITGPASINVQSNFTINRTYTVSGAAAPGSFTITYYASTSSSPNQDLSKATLLGSETLSSTADLAAGNHSGTSPSFQFSSGGSYYLLATLTSGGFVESDGGNDTNDVAVTSQAVQVLGPVIVDNGTAGYSETGTWNTESVLSYGGN
ncbi:MAG TPA: Ig-like domain-containing protein, partial [Gemmataceae bacterium]|nr:Ig-like domain-containing protein [Gemmataceae bacterium]